MHVGKHRLLISAPDPRTLSLDTVVWMNFQGKLGGGGNRDHHYTTAKQNRTHEGCGIEGVHTVARMRHRDATS